MLFLSCLRGSHRLTSFMSFLKYLLRETFSKAWTCYLLTTVCPPVLHFPLTLAAHCILYLVMLFHVYLSLLECKLWRAGILSLPLSPHLYPGCTEKYLILPKYLINIFWMSNYIINLQMHWHVDNWVYGNFWRDAYWYFEDIFFYTCLKISTLLSW